MITGGESGPGARPCDPDWVRGIRDLCLDTETAFFHKQWGGRTPKANGRLLDGRTWDEMPVVLNEGNFHAPKFDMVGPEALFFRLYGQEERERCHKS